MLLLKLLATVAGGLFAGAALYVSWVEQPARLECGQVLAVTEFGPSYRRGARMQASLALGGCLCALADWLLGASVWWLIGGLILGANIPYTLLIILPINRRLLDASLDKNSSAARDLLVRWGNLHRLRTLLGLCAWIIFLLALYRV